MYTRNISRKDLKTLINNYLINAVDGEAYGQNLTTDKEKINFVLATFEKEYVYPDNVKRYPNRIDLFAQWLMGLPSCFHIDFANHRIIEIAKEWESIPTNATDRQCDRILENWWNYISNKFFQLHKSLNTDRKGKYIKKADRLTDEA